MHSNERHPTQRPACRRGVPLTGMVAILVASLAAVVLGLPASAAFATGFDGVLTSQTPTRTYTVVVADGTLVGTLTFSANPARGSTPTAKVSLLDQDGRVLVSRHGTSPLTFRKDVVAGTYRLRVSTSMPLRNRSLSFHLEVVHVTPPSPTPAPEPEPAPAPEPEPAPAPEPEPAPAPEPEPAPAPEPEPAPAPAPEPEPAPAPAPEPAPEPAPTPSSGLTAAVCGTWVLYQVSSVTDLDRLRPRIEAALTLPGVAGFSVRFPWDAADITGSQTTHPILDKARQIAASQGKPLSIRFMAGAHTPARVFDAGAAYYLGPSGRKVPLPWDNATGSNDVFLDAYDAYVGKLAAWSRANGVSLMHLSWYGQDWAELNHGKEVRAASGYTQDVWMQGHRELIRVGARHTAADLAVEMPLSGYGPLSGGQSATLADEIIARVGQSSDRFFIQANGWDETREWGAPDMTVEAQFDQIWQKPVLRGLQMIQPDGYDWSRVFDRLDVVGATYGEVYLPSFWQVPGPTPQYNHNTEERIDQLEAEIEAFAERTC